MMRYIDVKGLTPKQIQEKFALEHTPTHLTIVRVPANNRMRVGVAGEQKWGKGGGLQYEAVGGDLPESAFRGTFDLRTKNLKALGPPVARRQLRKRD